MPNGDENIDFDAADLQGHSHEHPEIETQNIFLTETIAQEAQEDAYIEDDTTSDPERKFNLAKSVISNKSAKSYLDREFNELIDTGINVEVERFFEIYEQLFYKIDKFKAPNKNTHLNLVDQSLNIRNNFIDLCKPEGYNGLIKCDDEEEKIIENIELIDSQSYDKSLGVEEQNMLYPNGTFLRSEAQNEEGMPVWVMVRGQKRAIWNPSTYQTVKKALGNDPQVSDSSLQRVLTVEELNNVVNGPDINSDVDLILLLDTGTFDPEFTIDDVFTWRESVFTCLCGPSLDPDGAIPLYSVFGGGQPNNGDNGKCFIIYYDLNSEKQTIELSPGESTFITNPETMGRISHRMELIGGESSIPSAFSDPFTPVHDNDGGVHMMDSYGGMNDGVYIGGFVREVRYTQNGDPLTSTNGIEFLSGGDLDSNGFTDTIHTLEPFLPPANSNYVSSPTWAQHTNQGEPVPFAIYYYNVPAGISREVKNSIFSSAGPFLAGGRENLEKGIAPSSPYVRMITNGEEAKYEIWPPETDPQNEFKGTMGFNGDFNIANPADDYSYDSIKARDPELIEQVLDNPESLYYDNDFRIKNCLVNMCIGQGGKDSCVFGNSNQLGYIQDYIAEGMFPNVTDGGYGDPRDTHDLVRVGRTSANNLGWENSFTTAESWFWGNSSPYRTGYYVDPQNLGNSPLAFDVDTYDHFGNNLFPSSNPNGHGGLSFWPYMVHGAPIFEAYGLYFVIGRRERTWYGLHNPASGDAQGYPGRWFRTFLPIGYQHWTHSDLKKIVDYGVMFRVNTQSAWHGGDYVTGDNWGGSYLWKVVHGALTRIMNGTSTPGDYGLGRCVYPGFSHDFYLDYINKPGNFGHTSPWNATGMDNMKYDTDWED